MDCCKVVGNGGWRSVEKNLAFEADIEQRQQSIAAKKAELAKAYEELKEKQQKQQDILSVSVGFLASVLVVAPLIDRSFSNFNRMCWSIEFRKQLRTRMKNQKI